VPGKKRISLLSAPFLYSNPKHNPESLREQRAKSKAKEAKRKPETCLPAEAKRRRETRNCIKN